MGRPPGSPPAPTCYGAAADRSVPGWSADRYEVEPAPATRLVDEGDAIDLGDRHFEVLHLPGHSPGSTGYLVRGRGGKRWLFIGDATWTARGVTKPAHKMLPVIDGDRGRTAEVIGRLHQLSLEQTFDHLARVHTSNVIHLGARDGLAVGDDGQRLELRARKAHGPLRQEAAHVRRKCRICAEREPRRHLDQVDAATAGFLLELSDELRSAQRVHIGGTRDVLGAERMI